MSVKYPNAPSYKERMKIPKKDYHIVSDLFKKYRGIRHTLLMEKNDVHVGRMVSHDYESVIIKEKLEEIKIKNDKNEHDVHFLENYPALAIKHAMGESWGTTSPR
jgi:hypothetical protein